MTWTQVDDNGNGSDKAFSFSIGSKGYVGAGLYVDGGDFWEYDPALNSMKVEEFSLQQNYPNPFNISTTIGYHLPKSYVVTLKIYDTLGNEIRTIYDDRFLYPGSGSVVWNGKDDSNNMVSTGIYFYKMRAGRFSKIRKLLFLK